MEVLIARYENEVAMKGSVLLDEAVSLPVEDRAHLVHCLLQTLNPPDATHAAAWSAVARRRLEELKAGDIAPVDGEIVFARIQQRYGKWKESVRVGSDAPATRA